MQNRPNQPLSDIPIQHKLAPPKPSAYYKQKYKNATEAMAIAYLSGHCTLAEIGMEFSVSYATASRAVKAYEEDVKCKT